MILLDTSVLSQVFRRQHPGSHERRLHSIVEELLESEVPLGLPGIVLLEVLSGIRSEAQFRSLERSLPASFSIIHPRTSDYVEAARLKNICLKKGLTLSGADCLIATMTTAGTHQLFTLDRDFHKISGMIPLDLYIPSN